jgi:hypothetical protein
MLQLFTNYFQIRVRLLSTNQLALILAELSFQKRRSNFKVVLLALFKHPCKRFNRSVNLNHNSAELVRCHPIISQSCVGLLRLIKFLVKAALIPIYSTFKTSQTLENFLNLIRLPFLECFHGTYTSREGPCRICCRNFFSRPN